MCLQTTEAVAAQSVQRSAEDGKQNTAFPFSVGTINKNVLLQFVTPNQSLYVKFLIVASV